MSHALTSRKFGLVWLTAGLLAGLLLAFGAMNNSAQAQLYVSEGITGLEQVATDDILLDVELGARSSPANVWIYGSGYAPNQEIFVLVVDGNGVLSDITSQASVFPLMTNDDGAFATHWTLGRFTRNDIAGEGVKTIQITDTSFNALATTPLAFCDMTGRAKAIEADPEAEITVPAHCPA